MKKTIIILVIIFAFTFVIGFFVDTYGEKLSTEKPDAELCSMPFYGLSPKEIVKKSEFTTNYVKSSAERKHNIRLSSKTLNGTLVDVGAEFSFNDTVGKRTTDRGYKTAKIIFNGEFVDGIGGGVCQVSTTLYNAILLAGLTPTECHAHSLPVSYVEPSFDAMVNSNTSDLKFINTTKNPIIIFSTATDSEITVSVYGEANVGEYVRISQVTDVLPPPEAKIVYDENNEYPDLACGERTVKVYGKGGVKSIGTVCHVLNGKIISKNFVRKDFYKPVQGVVIEKKCSQNSTGNNDY